jgi:tetratricopeptide (TPR) repeat protein
MRKILFLGLMLLSLNSMASINAINDSLWKAAAEAYRNKAYEQALANYDTLINRGYTSAELYNNAGNAAYKSKHMGKAVWLYEKAFRLDPSNEEIKYNKDLMHYKISDRIEQLPSIAPVRWLNQISQLLAPLTWYWIGIALGLIFALSLLLRHRGLVRSSLLSRLSFILTIIALVLAFRAHHLIYGQELAVVQFPSVSILSAPDASGVELFQLHEGAVVEIGTKQSKWVKIKLTDGKEGWISIDAFKPI